MSFVGFTTMRADWLINRIRHKTIFTKNQTLHSQHFLFHMIVVIINFLIAAFLPLFFFPTHLLHLSNLRIRSSNSSIFFVRVFTVIMRILSRSSSFQEGSIIGIGGSLGLGIFNKATPQV